MPRISVVVPCHNYGDYVGAALESVVAQNDPDWECLVVDDGSTDATAKVAEQWHRSYPANIKWFGQANAGPGAARNRGARQASGDWLLFLDADDTLLPGALARWRDTLSTSPGASLIIAGAQTLRDGAAAGVQRAAPASADRMENFAAFVRGELCPFNGGAVLMHRRVMERLAYPESIRTSEDFVLFAQAISLFDCVSIADPAVALHRHAGSLRYNPEALDGARDTMIDLLFDPGVLPEAAMRFRREVESTWYLVVSRALHKHERHDEAVLYYRRAVSLYPRNILRSSYLGKFVASALRSAAQSLKTG